MLLLFFLGACQAVRVVADFEKSTDFSNYTTYNYYKDLQTGLGEFDSRRLVQALDAAMFNEGLLYSEEPDFLIDIEGTNFLEPQNNSVGVGLGGTGRNVGAGVSVGIPVGRSKPVMVLRITFVDTLKNKVFWEASVRSTL